MKIDFRRIYRDLCISKFLETPYVRKLLAQFIVKLEQNH